MQKLLRISFVPVLIAALAACGEDAAPDSDVAVTGDTMATSPATAPEPGATAAEGQLLDPESATREALMTVAGIDAALADEIIAGRPYADMTEVDAVLAARLDEAQREQVYRSLWKPIDLNNASEEEILLIPGVGNRMAHEFDEYRPYQQIEQFRREIGKYVDEEEVARLERYVEIR